MGIKTEKAIETGRTIYLQNVMPPRYSHRTGLPTNMLKRNENSKLGKRGVWQKGPFKGMPLYSLTLEERKTCPSDCHMWANCYGNHMPFATRFETDGIEEWLDIELEKLADKHDKFSVRLHVLGDFYSLNYVRFWEAMLGRYSGLYIYGYSHRRGGIGKEINRVFLRHRDRFVIFYSAGEDTLLTRAKGMRPVAITSNLDWNIPYCPEQEEKVTSCLECGLCTNPDIRGVQFHVH